MLRFFTGAVDAERSWNCDFVFCEGDIEGVMGSVVEDEMTVVDNLVKLYASNNNA